LARSLKVAQYQLGAKRSEQEQLLREVSSSRHISMSLESTREDMQRRLIELEEALHNEQRVKTALQGRSTVIHRYHLEHS